MNWLQRYSVRHYVRNSLWLLPAVSMVAALLAVRFVYWIDQETGWQSTLDKDTARTVVSAITSSLFTFVVFVSSALLVAVQLGSAQLTPRIIGIVFKDPVTKYILSLFVFTFTFAVGALVRIDDKAVPLLTVRVAAYGSVVSLAAFLYLIDHVGKALRPSGALRAVGILGHRVINSVYPRQFDAKQSGAVEAARLPNEAPTLTVPSLGGGTVLAFDVSGVAALAERADCVIELVPQVGDFVAPGDPLFRVYQGGQGLTVALQNSVAIGLERTLEQDPTFALRIMVDIASKGLSPAINDPTTAVLALDQIHHMLHIVGNRQLDDGRVRDAAGRLRLLYRTPGWEDFVALAATEIRQFGGVSIQIARRLRAMLEGLIRILPPERAPLLRQELALLRRSAERCFLEPEDRALADVSDLQGVGGKREDGQP